MSTLVVRSPSCNAPGKLHTKSQREESECLTLEQRTNLLRRAYFASSRDHLRWEVGFDQVLSQVTDMNWSWKSRPDRWIEDVVVACACVRGEQLAWHQIQLVNTWRLRDDAELRLNPAQASLFVERFWSELRRNTLARDLGRTLDRHLERKETPVANLSNLRMQEYRGCETLTQWLRSHVLSRIEALPLGSRADLNGEILDTIPRLRRLGLSASHSCRVPQAT